MKTSARKILFLDRTILALISAAAFVVLLSIMSFIYAGNIERENTQLKENLIEMNSLAADIIQIKNTVKSKENKIGRRKSEGVVSTLEMTLKGLGIEAQVIKPLGKVKLDDYAEENAELEMRDTDLNSIVNLLYKIDVSPLPLKIKSASIKTAFQDTDKFILKLTVSLISKS